MTIWPLSAGPQRLMTRKDSPKIRIGSPRDLQYWLAYVRPSIQELLIRRRLLRTDADTPQSRWSAFHRARLSMPWRLDATSSFPFISELPEARYSVDRGLRRSLLCINDTWHQSPDGLRSDISTNFVVIVSRLSARKHWLLRKHFFCPLFC